MLSFFEQWKRFRIVADPKRNTILWNITFCGHLNAKCCSLHDAVDVKQANHAYLHWYFPWLSSLLWRNVFMLDIYSIINAVYSEWHCIFSVQLTVCSTYFPENIVAHIKSFRLPIVSPLPQALSWVPIHKILIWFSSNFNSVSIHEKK